MLARWFILLAAIQVSPLSACGQEGSKNDASRPRRFRIVARSPEGLQELFRYTPKRLPLLSAHRGGAAPGYPENCLATFEHTLGHTFAILEVDPRLARDGIVLHHDATLERTTTGQGRVADFTLAELKQLRLKDPAGGVTEFSMPTLDEALDWARGTSVLVLDHKDVPVETLARIIGERRAESYAMLIVYDYADVQACHAANPNVMMEVMVPNRQKFEQFNKLGVPWRNVIAFVGHNPPSDRSLYRAIHEQGAPCMIGTSRNLDRQARDAGRLEMLIPEYRAHFDLGADLIETDLPAQLGPLLFDAGAIPYSKKQFFVGDRS